MVTIIYYFNRRGIGAEWERLALKWQFDHILITLFYIRWYKNFSSHLCIFE